MSKCPKCNFLSDNLVIHIDNELCQFLQTQKYGEIRGPDKVKCKKCGKKITVSGLHIHYKYNHSLEKKDITLLFEK